MTGAFASGGVVLNSGYRTAVDQQRVADLAGDTPDLHDGRTVRVSFTLDATRMQEALRKANFAMEELCAALRGELWWFRFGVGVRRRNAMRLGTKT